MQVRTRRVTLGVLLAAAWSGALALAGLRALTLAGSPPIASPGWMWMVAGGAFLAMGQLVFCALVADRLFPHANPWLSSAAHATAGAAVIGGAAWLLGGLLL